MSQKRTPSCDLTDSSPAKIARLDTSPDAVAETDPPGNTHSGYPSHVCALLASHDILTILVCNDAFVATIGIATLALLPRLAPQYKDILSLVSEAGRLRAVKSHIDGRASIPNSKRAKFRDVLDKVKGFIDAKDLLQGVFFFLTRRNGYPASFEAYQKELPLWWAFANSRSLRCIISHERYGLGLQYPFTSVEYLKVVRNERFKSSDDLRSLSPQDQFKILDSSILLLPSYRRSRRINIGHNPYALFLNIVRFDHHPYHTDEQISKLLPHELYFLQDASHAPCIRLVDCGVSVFSDWPEISHRIRTLIIDNSTNEVTDFSGFPEMQQLDYLRIRCNIVTLEGMPNTLPNLTRLDLSGCENIQSLNGLSQIPSIIKMSLPPLIENIEPLYQYFGQLKVLDLSRCSRITTLVGFPPLRKLNELRLPRSIQALDGFPSQLDSLMELDIWTCDRVESLKRLTLMPGLKNIWLPQSICLKNAVDIIHWFQTSPQWRSCSAKRRSHTTRLAFNQFWILLSLAIIDALSEANLSNQCLNVLMEEPSELLSRFMRTSGDENFNELIGDTRTAMDISAGLNIQLLGIDRGKTYIGCYAQKYDSILSVLEIPTGLVNWKSPLTKVTVHPQSSESSHRDIDYVLRIDQTAETMVWWDSKAECLVGMPPRFDYLKHLEIGWYSLKSLRGMPEMYLLETLTLRADIKDLQGLPPVLPSLMHLDISDCARLTSLKGMPEMPKLTTLILPPLIRSLQWMPMILYSLQSIDLSRCSELASLKEIPYLPNLRVLTTPDGLKTLVIPLNHIDSLEELDMSHSSSLESLDRFPYTPKLKILYLNGSFCNLRELPRCMPSLQILSAWCTSLTSLEGFPETPKLEELALPSSIASMRSLPSVFPTLTVFAVCDQGSPANETSLQGCHIMPNLQYLELSQSIRSFEGLPESLMNLLELHLYSCTNLESIEGLPRMPLLRILKCSGMQQSIFDELVARLRTDSPQLSVSG